MNDQHLNHDLDLVAAFADGDAGPDSDTARGLVESCAECRREYDLQRSMADWLDATPIVRMTDAERSALHLAVDEATRPAPVVSLSDRLALRWRAIGSVAAAGLITVGALGAINSMNGGDDASSDDISVALESAQRAPVDDASDGSDMNESFAAGATEMTEAAAEEAAMQADMAAPAPLIHLNEVSADEFAEAVTVAVEQTSLVPAPEILDEASFGDREMATPECLTSDVSPIFGVVWAVVGGSPVEAFIVPDPDTGQPTALAFAVGADGCTPYELGG